MSPKTHDPQAAEESPQPDKSQLPKAYSPGDVEDRIGKLWEDSGAFTADATSTKEPFVISMPPPNATGQLHLGHAVMLALEDIFTRSARMQGKEALWVPGTDHAAIATESVVIRKIQKEEKIKDPRAALGRAELVSRIAAFVEQSRGTIRSQIRKMGCSCDWTRERYTLDPSLNRCVNEVFAQMHRDGLIYRGSRVVNWDTALQTTISDDEIEHEEQQATLYTIEYLTAEDTGGEPVRIATSRPETKLGDSALAVHPDDERYRHLIGRHFAVRWPRGQKIHITVIGDHTIDPAFGTGVLGVTPLHSKADYEMWQRHKEQIIAQPIQVIGENGLILDSIPGYGGLSVEKCRELFVEDLRESGRLIAETPYLQPLSISYRSKKPVEPLPKLQWFIDVNKRVIPWKGASLSLKEVMQDVIRSGDIRIIPERFEKTYFHWIDHLQDWCISRQIWWGHRIPVWYRGDERHVGTDPPDVKGWEQDGDTLDTWFSSALWTWSTLVDPAKAADPSLSLRDILAQSPDFRKFHPTSVMETGYDILFFWVARMILMTTYTLRTAGYSEAESLPFRTVYLHGLVRTREGKKMSKSDPKTCIDPLDIIPTYGADALRLSMIVGQSPGNDFRLYEEKIAGYRNFINKLWNASRFVLLQCEQAKVSPAELTMNNEQLTKLSLADRAILSALQDLIDDVTKGLRDYRLSETGERLYGFVWETFCDWHLELSKGNANLAVLIHTLRTVLKLLHPYCPFVTEEIWSSVKPAGAGMLIKESWPEADGSLRSGVALAQMQTLIDVISAIRRMRAEQGIEPGADVPVIIHANNHADLLRSQQEHIVRLGRTGGITIDAKPVPHPKAASAFLTGVEVHIPLEGLIDIDKERAKVEKELEKTEGFVAGLAARLENEDFVRNAPEQIVESEREKLKEAKEKIGKLRERLNMLAA